MTSTEILLAASNVAKRFNSVVALKAASLEVRAGEVHALMGANGAGKSTLVKILTGVFSADGGGMVIRGRERRFRSPAEARQAGVVSVYQDPALVPDLTVAQNLRLARVRANTVREWLVDLGIPELDLGAFVRDLPYPVLRLIDLARATIAGFSAAVRGVAAPLYLTQNDGTMMQAEMAAALPVMSFASGATNSMRGAAFLSGLTDAMVIDVGGTTTDIGQLRRGFPREANSVVEVGGVRTLFRMPDLLSIGLGGGSLVSADGISVGPKSVGYRLIEEGLVFGGNTVTATDVAVAAGLARIGDNRAVADLPRNLVQRALDIVRTKIGDSVDRMKTDARELPLIAVGGGAFLVPDRLAGISQVSHVSHGDCANAVGAAIAQVSGETDQVYRDLSRDEAIAAAEAQARERAIVAGAERGTLQTVDVEDIPLAYLPGNALRVRVRVAGEMASSTNQNGSSSVSQ